MIGLVTTSYPRTPDDWAGAFVRQRALALAATDTVEIIAAGPSSGEPGVVRVPSPLFGGAGAPEVLEAGGACALLEGMAFTARLAGVVRERAPRWSAVESHWLVPCGLVACTLANGRPHRAFSHGGDVALLERLPGGAAVAGAIARSGASLVFASADLRNRFARLCGRPAASLPATVEPAPFDEALFQRRTPEQQLHLRQSLAGIQPLVLGVGRLVPVKGFDVLIRALARLPPARRPRLVLLGDGPERRGLQARAARARVDLQLPGVVTPAAVAAWMAAADLYVQPSRPLETGRSEGMPVAVREALAVGVPVIASAVGGMSDLGAMLTLVPPAEPGALARAIMARLGSIGPRTAQ
jgi:glycosyltransferase involved in cell wall biosynthesis